MASGSSTVSLRDGRSAVVRIYRCKRVSSSAPALHSAALAVASLLARAALAVSAVTSWALAAELHLTAKFLAASGLFSHRQVWLAAAAALFFYAWLAQALRCSHRFGCASGVISNRAISVF